MQITKIDLILKKLEKTLEEKLANVSDARNIKNNMTTAKIREMENLLKIQKNEIKNLKIIIKETVENITHVISELEKFIE